MLGGSVVARRDGAIIPTYAPWANAASRPATVLPSLTWMGPASLAIFVYAGQLKASPLLSWFPLDLTLASSAVGVVAFLLARAIHGPGTWAIVLPIALWMTFFLGVYQASWDEYAELKLRTLYTFTFFAVLAPFHLLRLPSQRRAFLITLGMVSVAAAVLTLADPAEGSRALVLEGTNTIGTSRIAGTGALIFFILAVVLRGKARRILCVGLSIALFGVLVAVGSRGPFLGILVGIIGVLVLSPVLRRRRFAGLFWSASLAATAFWWATQQTFYGGDRAFAWLSGERDRSTDAREFMWDLAWKNIPLEPAGIGWGDFANLASIGANLRYPHNLFLEVFYEAGWIAGAALLIFVVASLVRLWRRSHEPATAVLFALLLFTIVNAMVSGDINDNRLLWLLLSCAWVIPPQDNQQTPALPQHYEHLRVRLGASAASPGGGGTPPRTRPAGVHTASVPVAGQ